MDRVYFASLPTEEVGKEIYSRIEAFYTMIDTFGFFAKVRKAHNYYYGSSGDGTASGKIFNSSFIRRGGTQGETYDFKVNQYRNLLQHILVMTTSERIQMDCQATNTDSKSLSQAELGNSLLEYYFTEQRAERQLIKACEYALVYTFSHLAVTWDTQAGTEFGKDPESGKTIYNGDNRVDVFTPLDVVIDLYREPHKHLWKIPRTFENKYDLATTYPEKADVILQQESKDRKFDNFSFRAGTGSWIESDDIAVYHFYHERTPACPEGRYVQVIDGGHVLFDGPLPYKRVPVYSMYAATMAGTSVGYSSSFDLLSLQEASDTLHSSVLTNQAAFGTQLIGLPKGSDINYRDLGKGLAVIEFEAKLGPPVPIQLTSTPPELFKYIEQIDVMMEKISGLNSIVRGQPQGQLTGASGAAMALLAATAQQFNQGLQREYEFLAEDAATGMMHNLQTFATTRRVALLAGIAKRSMLKDFSGDDINAIERVRIKRSSALSRTTAGKIEIADAYMQKGWIATPAQHAEVMETGTLQPMLEGPLSELLLIRRENEKLRSGEIPPILRTDEHPTHIQEHKALLSDPDIRYNPMITQAVLSHIQQHEMMMAPPSPPMQPGAPMDGPQPSASGVMAPTEGTMAEQMPIMPNQPELPQGAPPQSQIAYEQMQAQGGA